MISVFFFLNYFGYKRRMPRKSSLENPVDKDMSKSAGRFRSIDRLFYFQRQTPVGTNEERANQRTNERTNKLIYE